MISSIFLIFKSLIFWINLILSVLFFGPFAFLFGIISYTICLYISKLWCRYNLFILKNICSLSYEINGPDINTHSIVISRHQSAWETIFLAAHIRRPIFILKRELLMIPFFGWCLYLLKNISINRSDGASSLKKIMKACDEHINNDRTLIIFPEGTRVPYGKNIEIKKGIFKILDSLKLPSIIINHNAGKFWSKDSFLIKPGTIVIQSLQLQYNVDQSISKNEIQEHFLIKLI
jgi:1-acyl-sn-glycerol-3-phosphate acyltransferase